MDRERPPLATKPNVSKYMLGLKNYRELSIDGIPIDVHVWREPLHWNVPKYRKHTSQVPCRAASNLNLIGIRQITYTNYSVMK